MIRIYQDVPIHLAYVRNWLCKNIFITVDLQFGRSPTGSEIELLFLKNTLFSS